MPKEAIHKVILSKLHLIPGIKQRHISVLIIITIYLPTVIKEIVVSIKMNVYNTNKALKIHYL